MAYVRDTDLGMKRILKELEGAPNIDVITGVQQGDKNKEGLDIAEYAAANEYGTSKIPERSFMRSAFDENRTGIIAKMDANFQLMLAGKYNLFQALSLVGLFVETKTKEKIASNIQPKNSPATIKAKGSSRTLIDTSAMINSIRYIVRRGK